MNIKRSFFCWCFLFIKLKYEERFVKLCLDFESPHSNARCGHKQEIYFTVDDTA
jgi:hypothetical protein